MTTLNSDYARNDNVEFGLRSEWQRWLRSEGQGWLRSEWQGWLGSEWQGWVGSEWQGWVGSEWQGLLFYKNSGFMFDNFNVELISASVRIKFLSIFPTQTTSLYWIGQNKLLARSSDCIKHNRKRIGL